MGLHPELDAIAANTLQPTDWQGAWDALANFVAPVTEPIKRGVQQSYQQYQDMTAPNKAWMESNIPGWKKFTQLSDEVINTPGVDYMMPAALPMMAYTKAQLVDQAGHALQGMHNAPLVGLPNLALQDLGEFAQGIVKPQFMSGIKIAHNPEQMNWSAWGRRAQEVAEGGIKSMDPEVQFGKNFVDSIANAYVKGTRNPDDLYIALKDLARQGRFPQGHELEHLVQKALERDQMLKTATGGQLPKDVNLWGGPLQRGTEFYDAYFQKAMQDLEDNLKWARQNNIVVPSYLYEPNLGLSWKEWNTIPSKARVERGLGGLEKRTVNGVTTEGVSEWMPLLSEWMADAGGWRSLGRTNPMPRTLPGWEEAQGKFFLPPQQFEPGSALSKRRIQDFVNENQGKQFSKLYWPWGR